MLRNFSYVIEDEIAGCAHPDYAGDCDESLAELQEHGIGALVSLDECGIPLYLVADHDMHYLHLAVPDFGVPTMAQANEFMAFVDRERAEGRKLAVHCGAGYGRTGTMLACYLTAKGEQPDNAIARVRELRPGSIETREQEEFVRQFAATLSSSPPPEPAPAERKRRFGIRRKTKQDKNGK